MRDVDLASAARQIGYPARARMLTALLDGRALSAGELARIAGIGAATASGHLARLVESQLVVVRVQGRHRYFALAGPEVAQGLEALALISPPAPVASFKLGRAAEALRPARMCYDHLAGELGVQIHDHLVRIDGISVGVDGVVPTDAGIAWFRRAGVDDAQATTGRRPALRLCLDWTERRNHLAGALAAALATQLLQQGWIERRAPGQRGLTVTQAGRARLDDLLAPDWALD